MVYDAWGKGRIDIEPVGNGAIRYTLSYIDKQVFGCDELYKTYGDFQPPFCLFSKGIGTKWIEKNIDKFDAFGKITFGTSGKSYTLNPYYRRKYDFMTKEYNTPFSDSVIAWAKQKKMSLYDAYIDRCKLREQNLQRKMIHKREPLYVCSKAIIKKEFAQLKNKKNVDINDYQNFTKRYLKRDENLIFSKDTLSHFNLNQNMKSIDRCQKYNEKINNMICKKIS